MRYNIQTYKRTQTKHPEYIKDVDLIITRPMYDNGEKYYGYISKQTVDLEEILKGVTVKEKPKVLDIGVGYGEMLLYLGHVLNTEDLHGVEINQEYYEKAKTLIEKHGVPIKIYHADYRDHAINQYDVIYSFSIAKGQPERGEMYKYVLENAKTGAIWIETLGIDLVKTINTHPRKTKLLYNKDNVIIIQLQ